MEEIWKDIKGYEGFFMVSNLGRVKRVPRISINKWSTETFLKEKILNPTLSYKGYPTVTLRKEKNKDHKTFFVHRLVANHFLGNPENKQQINHIDGNKKNNKVDNLEFCTQSENIKHAYKIGLINKKLKSQKFFKPITQYTLDGKAIRDWESITSTSETLGISTTCICACVRGRQKTSGGYLWKYKKCF